MYSVDVWAGGSADDDEAKVDITDDIEDTQRV